MSCPQPNLTVPEPQGIYIEPTNICTLKCNGCARTDFITKWPRAWHNHSLDIEQLMRFLDVDLDQRTVLLSGNYGDPIYHPEFVNMVRALKSRGARLKITTNGSYRTESWWQELAQHVTAHDMIIFSIDGLPENFSQYRVNADWPSIAQAIAVMAHSPVHMAWKYIPFDFNQNNIAQAKALSVSLGFDEFYLDPSKRFDDQATQPLQPRPDLVNPELHNRVTWKLHTAGAVSPRCAGGQEHFVTADGYYTPCCYVADHRWLFKTDFGRQRDRYSIAHHTLQEILSQPAVVDFYADLPNQPVCQFSCPNHQLSV